MKKIVELAEDKTTGSDGMTSRAISEVINEDLNKIEEKTTVKSMEDFDSMNEIETAQGKKFIDDLNEEIQELTNILENLQLNQEK